MQHEESCLMKKALLIVLVFLLSQSPALGGDMYRIRLKNGGQVVTPRYWYEGSQILFHVAGGISGMERSEVAGVDRYSTEGNVAAFPSGAGERQKPPSPANSEEGIKQQATAALPSHAGEQPADLSGLKAKKDQMTAELEMLLEKLREATSRRDNDAKESIKKEIRLKSAQIYKLTDEATAKNKGRLPDGWWAP